MPSAEDCAKFWKDKGFKSWGDLTAEEKDQIKKETPELAGGADEEYASFVWIRGYKDAWYFVSPATNPWE